MEYAFGAEEAARTAPPVFLTAVERKAAELVRAAEAQYLHGRAYGGDDPKGGDTAPGTTSSSSTAPPSTTSPRRTT
ncbi:hypothetical protein BC342_15020 [Streptomyces olivaceus]|nr:hypothetical protein BC342_15020 [Streptomyces olivaceus]